jgi:hypothetical protein
MARRLGIIGGNMNSRIASVVSGIKSIASACNPVLKEYRVTYFKEVPDEKLGINVLKKFVVIQEGYSSLDAAKRVNPDFEPGYNCWATRKFSWEK